jgi:hypothetical protein
MKRRLVAVAFVSTLAVSNIILMPTANTQGYNYYENERRMLQDAQRQGEEFAAWYREMEMQRQQKIQERRLEELEDRQRKFEQQQSGYEERLRFERYRY